MKLYYYSWVAPLGAKRRLWVEARNVGLSVACERMDGLVAHNLGVLPVWRVVWSRNFVWPWAREYNKSLRAFYGFAQQESPRL